MPQRQPPQADPRRPVVGVSLQRPRYFSAMATDPAHEIAEVVGQIDVVPIVVPIPAEIAVAAEGDLFDEIQAERIVAETVRRFDRIDDRARASCSYAGRSAS